MIEAAASCCHSEFLERTNSKSSRVDLLLIHLESLYCNNTRLEIKGGRAPLPRILGEGGQEPPPSPSSYAYVACEG